MIRFIHNFQIVYLYSVTISITSLVIFCCTGLWQHGLLSRGAASDMLSICWSVFLSVCPSVHDGSQLKEASNWSFLRPFRVLMMIMMMATETATMMMLPPLLLVLVPMVPMVVCKERFLLRLADLSAWHEWQRCHQMVTRGFLFRLE